MSALSTLGQRQQSLLKALLYNRDGLTMDEMIQELSISRNAVRQHLTNLQRDNLIETSSLNQTGGRPSHVYTLTNNGLELFPRHYALFSNLLFRAIRKKLGSKGAKKFLVDIGNDIANEFSAQVSKQPSIEGKVSATVEIMKELGYESRMEKKRGKLPEIVASNCVFHQLATEYEEVCDLDLTLLANLTEYKIEHKECMVRGGKCCRFGLVKPLDKRKNNS